MKFSVQWLVERMVRETSLSEGDVRNVLITLRTTIPSKMLPKEKDVTAASFKNPYHCALEIGHHRCIEENRGGGG